jgi:hypothetical protein
MHITWKTALIMRGFTLHASAASATTDEAIGLLHERPDSTGQRLRVSPGISRGIAWLSRHEPDGERRKKSNVASKVLPVLGKSAAPAESGEGWLYDQAFWKDDEALT